MIRAPLVRAAAARPVISKQLSGLLMGLSVTSTWAAPALKQRPATAASSSGWVVAPREAGVAKAALTLMSTRSPFWMKDSMPSQGLNPLLEHGGPVRAPDDGHLRLVRGPAAGVKSPKPVRAFGPSEGAGPWESYRARPKPPAARVRTEAYPNRLRKSRRFSSPVRTCSSSSGRFKAFP